jgi:hypothetical protein
VRLGGDFCKKGKKEGGKKESGEQIAFFLFKKSVFFSGSWGLRCYEMK